ncbi:MAG: oligoendopeptidase F [Eubacterium sp.]|nr:oligoendopeptidase F [Eubacterium sp.]
MAEILTPPIRDDIPEKDRWTIDELFPEEGSWQSSLDEAMSGAEALTAYRGKLGASASALADALIKSDETDQRFERLYTYARMKLDENNGDPESQARHDKAVAALSRASAMTSFMIPEIVSVPEETINSFIGEEPRLRVYEHLLRDLMREKSHVLSEKEEALLAGYSEVIGAPDNLFTMLNDADIKFGEVTRSDGTRVPLTHGSYINLMRSHDRAVRKEAYEKTYAQYKGHINTIAANYSVNVKTDVISARTRHYPSARAAAMFSGNIPEAVYDNLITAVNDALPVLHDYIALRKDILGVDELKMYDVYVPLVEIPERSVPFDDAVALAQKGLSVLGDEYLREFNEGISSGWIDKYENQGKTSGAYSFGSYDSKPYVLLNYDNTLEDLFTVVHEMGHSMNSLYTRRTQPFVYGDHSIFTAEVASTVNETLMMRWLLENETDPDMKRYILNMYIEAFRTTLFRQTMFAEFEKLTHDQCEAGESLTAEWMNEQYDSLNTKYFGAALTHDDMIQYEWARIPHFYRSFYVYQYATGYSAANAIADRLLTEGEDARNDYLEFLKCGSNDYPVELLKIAGVDMEKREPVDRALKMFKDLVHEFRSMM